MHKIFVLVLVNLSINVCTSAQIFSNQILEADNTIYENGLSNSNGTGQNFFAGNTATGSPRRALIKFNLNIPIPLNNSSIVVTNATITLRLNKSKSSTDVIKIHRMLANWGEGVSNAGGQEGGGVAATQNDATWDCNNYDGVSGCTTSWQNPGGDYVLTPSASTAVGPNLVDYSFTSTQLINDVQNIINGTNQNFGWIIIGDETTTSTANRFASKENAIVAARPRLMIGFNILPITLSSFSGFNHATENTIQWQTAQEINNNYFNLQHSTDAVHFNTIAKINSKGNSAIPQFYFYKHQNVSKGKHYYRLIQTDFDNRSSISNIIELYSFDTPNKFTISPNPVLNNIDVQKLQFMQAQQYSIINSVGALMQTGKIIGSSINVSTLAGGTYYLRVTNQANVVMSASFVKQ